VLTLTGRCARSGAAQATANSVRVFSAQRRLCATAAASARAQRETKRMTRHTRTLAASSGVRTSVRAAFGAMGDDDMEGALNALRALSLRAAPAHCLSAQCFSPPRR
jgi:hypothetical protein